MMPTTETTRLAHRSTAFDTRSRTAGVALLADARMVERLRNEDSAAQYALWTQWRPAVKAMCDGMSFGEIEARALAIACRRALETGSVHWTPGIPVRAQVAATVWRILTQELHLHWLTSARASQLVILMDQTFGCSEEMLGDLLAIPAEALRYAKRFAECRTEEDQVLAA